MLLKKGYMNLGNYTLWRRDSLRVGLNFVCKKEQRKGAAMGIAVGLTAGAAAASTKVARKAIDRLKNKINNKAKDIIDVESEELD